jgi:2-polyprenyl-6-methoxyphenol hydroxylase-like FAD-dependent oxidoreductase
MKSKPSSEREHAIVIGGSMAGLLAARVLSDYYRHVTVLERDALTVGRESRRGVPQGRHTHGLLAGGRQALETLFPGLSQQLVADGAVPGDIVGDSRWFVEGACHSRFPSGLQGLLMSRPFLEGAVRERVRQLPNVQFRDNQAVSSLTTSADKSRVTGVRIGDEILAADLVVDTAGRGSHSPQWLEEMGYPKPEEERVEVGLSYTTRLFRRDPRDLDGDLAVIIPSTPSGKHGGVMIAQEDGRWTVTLISHFGPAAPADLEGFIEFARGLPASYIYEVVRNAEPVGEAIGYRFPASMRRRYEKLTRFPQGYLVMGDAMSSFNPIYGQGMTVAALEALELHSTLADGARNLSRRFFARAAKVVDIPWSIAVGNDLRMPEATGPRTLGLRLINAYLAKLHKAAHRDPEVTLAFHRVANLMAPPASILHPRIVLRVLNSVTGYAIPKFAAAASENRRLREIS